MAKHLSDYQGVVNQLLNMGMALDDEIQALLLLTSLSDTWETLVVSLSNLASNGELAMDMVKESLLNEEFRRRERSLSSQNNVNVVEKQHHGRSKGKNPHS